MNYRDFNPPFTTLSEYNFSDKKRHINEYADYMFLRTYQMFDYENLPETIPKYFLEQYLQRNGQCVITKVDDKLYAFTGGKGGFPDPYYQPTKYTVANPALNFSKNLEIGIDCALIRNDINMIGLIPLFSKYASLLVESDITMRIETINRRIPNIASFHSDNQKAALDEFEKHVEQGDLSIGLRDSFDESFRTSPYSSGTNRITDLIEFHEYIKGMWYNELGMKASYNMKREALSEHEISANEDVLIPLVEHMYIMRQKGVEDVNKLFGTNISVRYNSVWDKNITNMESDKEISELEPDLMKSEIVDSNSEGTPENE